MTNAFGPPTTSAPRCYETAAQTADEAGRARIFQGIHVQFSNQNGRDNGDTIGTYIVKNRLGRLDRCAADEDARAEDEDQCTD